MPLLVRELVLDGLERQRLIEHHRLWRWRGDIGAGGRLLELIRHRIGQLASDERALLELIAIGEPLAWSLLDSDEAAAAERLMRRELIVADREGRRLEVRLAHPLYGEAVRGPMPPYA